MSGSLFLWGLLGLVQIVFLPGYLLVRALRVRPGIVDGLLLSFGLSGLVNYLLVQLLVFFHILTRPVTLGVIGVEILIAVFLAYRDPSHDHWQRTFEAYRIAVADWFKLIPIERTITAAIALLAFYSVFSLAHAATASWQDEAFTLWDNVMSWNRWAVEWSNNKFPWKTYHYPQLLPANSSIIYVLAGTSGVQSFSRLFFAFYPIAIFGGLMDLGLRRRQLGFWLGIPPIYFAWIFMARPFPAEGYADVPVTFMILMAVYSVLAAREQTSAHDKTRWIMISGMFAGAALVTKQTGVFILISLPVFLALLADPDQLLSPQKKRRTILWAFAVAFLLSVPWYIIKEVQIRTGVDQSEIGGSVVAHAGRSLPERIQNGVQQMFTAWGTGQTIIVGLLALMAAFLRDPWAWVMRLIVLPGFLVWSITTSYDLRNSNFCVILGCVSAGVALGHILSKISSISRKWPQPGYVVATLAFLAVLITSLSFFSSVSNDVLVSRSNQAQKTTAMPDLNAALFRLIDQHKITRPIVTNYWMMFFIPGLKEFMTYDGLTVNEVLKNHVDQTHPEYIAILHPSQNYTAVSEQIISEKMAAGSWSVAEIGPSYKIIRINPPPPAVSLETSSSFSGYRIIEGLAPNEGPYPQWNLPVVRWGLGPATKLELDVNRLDEPCQLALEIDRAQAKMYFEIILNDLVIIRSDLDAEPKIRNLKYPLNVRTGRNTIEIRYSTWDKQAENRPLAVLYRSLKITHLP